MTVAIVMPAYNSEAFIGQAIGSVLAQTRADWKLFVIDDGSTDETAQVASWCVSEPAGIRLIRQENRGIAAARNRGISEAWDADYVAFIDSDDVWDPDSLDRLMRVLEANPAAVGVHGMLRYVDAKGRPITVDGASVRPVRRRCVAGFGLRMSLPTEPTTFETLAYGNCVPTPSVIVRREFLQLAGPFDPAATVAEDWDLWLRLAAYGDFAYLNEPTFSYRQHRDNSSKNTARKHDRMAYVRSKLETYDGLTGQQRRTLAWGRRYAGLYRLKTRFA